MRHSISPRVLAQCLGTPSMPTLIDLCLPEDFAADPRLIPGAQRMAHHEVAGGPLPLEGQIVFVCQKGLKLSQGAAAIQRAYDRPATYLAGGARDWAAAGLPLWPTALHPVLGQRGSLWVLAETLSADDLLTAWIIQRFVDPAPRWIHVNRAQTAPVAERFDAVEPGGVTTALSAVTGPLQSHLKALEAMIHAPDTPDTRRILDGLLRLDLPSTRLLQASRAIFDGLWATLYVAALGDAE